MIRFIVKQLANSPFYPHWLEFYKREVGNKNTLKNLKGAVIEVGAGNNSMKYDLISKYNRIRSYISTDSSDWNKQFKEIDVKVNNFWGISGEFFRIKKRVPIDKMCSALDLPFNDNQFDYHLSFEVLEHIENPYKFFSEASRVLKKGGYIIMSAPFLYRRHYLDYFRYTEEFFIKISKANNLKLKKIYSNTGYGTTLASLTNQWLIQCILRSNIFVKIFLLVCSPLVFFSTNIIGFLIDIKPDRNFTTRFHVIMQKQ